LLRPEIVFQIVNLAPNETITIITSLKPEHYSLENSFYLYSQNPEMTQYSIEIDNQIVISPVRMIPTEGPNTEKVIFRKNRIKKNNIKLIITNLDKYVSLKLWFKADVSYIYRTDYELVIEPMINLLMRKLLASSEEYWGYEDEQEV